MSTSTDVVCPVGVFLQSLPLDLLAVVFGCAPHNARLRAISLVCKRWRTAALYSITSLRVTNQHIDLSSSAVAAAFALVPSLSRLYIGSDAPYYLLQTSLQSLDIAGDYIDDLLAEGARGGKTFLSDCFPNLTELTLNENRRLNARDDAEMQPLVQFAQAHSSHIERLKLGCLPGSVFDAIAALPWPRLQRLAIIDGAVPPLGFASGLRELELIGIRASVFVRLPDELLAAVTLLHFWFEGCMYTHDEQGTDDKEVIARIPKCAKLRLLVPFFRTSKTMVTHAALLSPTLAEVWVDEEQGWQWLAQFTALTSLTLCKPCALPSLPSYHPVLRQVSLGSDMGHPFDAADGLLLATALLHVYPHIRKLALRLRVEKNSVKSVAAQIAELITLGASRCLTDLDINSSEPLPALWSPPAVQCGWVRATLTCCKK